MRYMRARAKMDRTTAARSVYPTTTRIAPITTFAMGLDICVVYFRLVEFEVQVVGYSDHGSVSHLAGSMVLAVRVLAQTVLAEQDLPCRQGETVELVGHVHPAIDVRNVLHVGPHGIAQVGF